MRVVSLALRDFRNYTRLDLDPAPGLTIVVGANAQGKTNLLEALMVASRLRSPRTEQLREVIRWGEEAAEAHVTVRQGERTRRIDLVVGARGAAVKVNGETPRRRADAIGSLLAVLFTPDDLRLVKDEPERRRAFLDGLLALTRPQLAGLPAEYARVLRQRNTLLKQVREGIARPDHLEPWDEALARHGTELAVARAAVCDALAREAREHHRRLAPEQRLGVSYSSDILVEGTEPAAVRERFGRRLAERRADEMARGITLVGPHRDDLTIVLDEHSARDFASQGQQRTVVLALKLAELDVIGTARGESPVLLLDDVMSELDRERRMALARSVAGLEQAIITTTTPEYFTDTIDADASWLRLEEGALVPA